MIQMRGKNVGVVKVKETKKSAGTFDSIIALPDDDNSAGIIKYLGKEMSENSDLKVGTKVYFGGKRYTVVIGGEEILIMDEDNIVAVSEEPITKDARNVQAEG